MNWKIIAIVFITLFVLETAAISGIYYIGMKEIEKENICYYDVCEEYPEALIDGDICRCYEYDLLGELVIAKTKLMK